MKIEFLIATTNRTDLTFLEKMFQNIDIKTIKILIINQCFEIPVPKNISTSHQNIRIISVNEKGLSKSRNLALKNAIGDICVIADDDIVYEKDILEKIQYDYATNNFDMVTYRTIVANKTSKKYGDNFNKHNVLSIMSVCSIQITLNSRSIINHGILFDEKFGVGSVNYPCGEENIFLKDCLDNHLQCFSSNFILNTHPSETNGDSFSEKHLIAKGAVFTRMFSNTLFALFILWAFICKKTPLIVKQRNWVNTCFYASKEVFLFKKNSEHEALK